MCVRLTGIVKMVCTITSSALHCTTLRTLFTNALLQCRKDCAHRKLHAVQSKCARWSSVFVPCLQIRVGRFDSGSRLHHSKPLIRYGGFFFCVIGFVSTLVHGFMGCRVGLHFRQGCRLKRLVLINACLASADLI